MSTKQCGLGATPISLLRKVGNKRKMDREETVETTPATPGGREEDYTEERAREAVVLLLPHPTLFR